MTGQPTLDGRPAAPADGGLWRRYLDGDTISHAAWLRACADGSFVGNCRHCNDLLVPERPDQRGDRTDYAAHCRNPGCRHELNAPGGRVLRHSSRKSDQPKTGG